MDNNRNLEELRKDYFQHLEQRIPQRAKGIPYQKIVGPSGLIWLFLGLFICPFVSFAFGWAPYWIEGNPIIVIILSVITFSFLLLPSEFYHEDKRTKRWAKKHYPHIYRKIYQLCEQSKKDSMTVGLPLLKIEGSGYFFGYYVYRRWWQRTFLPRITGYVILTETGKLINDENLFEKTFLAYNYGAIGAVSGQNTAIGEHWSLTEGMNIYVPRSEKVLKMQRNYFEQSGYSHDWQNLMDHLPDLYAAATDALTIYDGREKFRKSMGYSFGYEYFYEDATQEFAMRQAFCKYMLAAHFKTLNNVRVLSARLHDNIKNDGGMAQKPIAMKALKKIWDFAFMLSRLIDRMAQQGIPSDEDRRLYREKTTYAQQISDAPNNMALKVK